MKAMLERTAMMKRGVSVSRARRVWKERMESLIREEDQR